MSSSPDRIRTRRAAPPFRRVVVRQVARLSPRLVRVTFTGPELEGFDVPQPAASVRLLIPAPEDSPITLPTWDRNNFVLPDGSRPTLRTFTPRRVDRSGPELDLEMVVHGDGPASNWAEHAEPGVETAISGPARGYTIDPEADDFLLVGDETAIPAIGQLLEVLDHKRPVRAIIEVGADSAVIALPAHPSATVDWNVQADGDPPGSSLATEVAAAAIGSGTRVWAAGEAAAMQRIRRYLFAERGLSRSSAWVRGYWKYGKAGDDADT